MKKLSNYLCDKVESLSFSSMLLFLTSYQLTILLFFKLPFFNHL